MGDKKTFGAYLDLGFARVLRPLLRHRSNSSRIGADFFRGLSNSLNLESGSEVTRFISGDTLSKETLPSLDKSIKVLLVGSSDRDFSSADFPEIRKGLTVFCQNFNDKETEQLKLLPIGVEDMWRAMHGLPHNFARIGIRKRHKVLVGPFGSTHEGRASIVQTLSSCDLCVTRNVRTSMLTSSLRSSMFAFSACPRGNGLDTHRFWETLYRGGIPVVISSEWSRTLRRFYKVPLLEVRNFTCSEIHSALQTKVNFEPKELEFLRPLWWAERFRALMRNS